jgi:5'-nucleotidase
VLISTILRQYFMSLKVMGKWKRWGDSMSTKFHSIQTNLQKNHGHAFHDPSPISPTASTTAPPQHPSISRVVDQSSPPDASDSSDPDADEDEDDGPLYDEAAAKPIQFSDRQIEMVRRVMRKWWRVAGLKGNPELCDELGGGEFQVNWTKAIAPRLEGRIKDVGPSVAIEA